ncbi:MarR family winged helix-turn-helix transcriptional regulator [Sphingomonas abaci]|uniref:DNA-binding MarR family transcriptional regulator n=1 Tax=Sphingomonas abaci TaxID=237611 RepID=A0A7W7APA1_9SPHN|nr:MarR family transcriptional regulator [Sphingomonas abaci]MBB4619662.1 DNA-binding MarR family transcriptional regulator [Sphingomonas abaci]
MSDPVAAKDEDDPLLLDRQVCFPLYAATNLLNRLYGPVLAELDLTYPQYLVMLVLWEHETQTVGALGARLYLDSGTLSPLLKRMEATGLVERRRDPADERRVLVGITAQGRALRASAEHVPETIGGGYAPDGIEELRESVRGLVAILAQRDGRASPLLPRTRR